MNWENGTRGENTLHSQNEQEKHIGGLESDSGGHTPRGFLSMQML
jgi:hypothetical protein